jgi:hypothetical protein
MLQRWKSLRTARRAVVVGLGSALLVTASTMAAAPSGAATPGQHVGVSSSKPFSAQGAHTLTALKQLAAQGKLSLSLPGQVSAQTSTPSGYHLEHPGYRRTNYTYDSDWVYHDDVYCSFTCVLKAETKVQLHEYLYGGSSHTWALTYNAQTVSDPAGITWQYHYRYYCGVNIANASDTICTNGASASGSEYAFSPGHVSYPTWGATNSITVFPMVALSTHFSTGIVVETKFRGYDTLSRSSTTRLNTSSGTGN